MRTQRGFGRTHPFAGEIRLGEVEVELVAEDVGFAVPLAQYSQTQALHVIDAVIHAYERQQHPGPGA